MLHEDELECERLSPYSTTAYTAIMSPDSCLMLARGKKVNIYKKASSSRSTCRLPPHHSRFQARDSSGRNCASVETGFDRIRGILISWIPYPVRKNSDALPCPCAACPCEIRVSERRRR